MHQHCNAIKRYCFFTSLLLLIGFPLKAQTTGEWYNNNAFFDDFTGDRVNSFTWQIANWKEHGGQTSSDRCFVKDGILNMIFKNDRQNGFLSSAIQTYDEFLYGKWEARLKPSNIPGVLNSFYTIDWNNTLNSSTTGDGTKQEIDIEFLTYTFANNAGKVHYALHAENRTSFETNPDISLGFNPSDDFHVWSINITPKYIEWAVDGTVLKKYVYEKNHISITAPYQLKLNTWSATNWVNGPPAQDVECIYQIDWIKFTPYSATPIINKKDLNLSVNQNNPNPFNSISKIKYTLNAPGEVKFSLINSGGQVVINKNLGQKSPGSYNYDLHGEELKPGFYYYTIATNNFSKTQKCVVTR